MKKLFLIVVCLLQFFLFGCGDDSKKVHGIWRSESVSSISKTPTIFTITDSTISINRDSEIGITFETSGKYLNIANAAHKTTILSISDIKDNSFTGEFQGKREPYTRITEEEAIELSKPAEHSKFEVFPDF